VAGEATADPHVLHGGIIVDFLPLSVARGLRGEPAAFRQRLEADEQRGSVTEAVVPSEDPTLAMAGSARVSTSALCCSSSMAWNDISVEVERRCRSSAISDRLSSEKRKTT
jgi:hypothetical protein